jgi:hypothetical protein
MLKYRKVLITRNNKIVIIELKIDNLIEGTDIVRFINPLNAELNPICHLLVLLGDLTFMGPCVVSISNNLQRYTVYSYLETALHVSGGTFTHHQEHSLLGPGKPRKTC